MTTNDFFTTLWAILGVILLLLALAALVAVGAWGISFLRSLRRAAADARVALPDEREARLGFGDFQFVTGTRYLMSAYGTTVEYNGSLAGSYRIGAARNYLFLHVDDLTTRYLLPTLAQNILTAEMLRVPTEESDVTNLHASHRTLISEMMQRRRDLGERDAPVKWLCFHIVDTDTNGDGRLTEEDGYAIAFANPDGTGLWYALRGVTSVLGRAFRQDGNIILLIYQLDKTTFVSEVNIAERTVVRTEELPAVGALA